MFIIHIKYKHQNYAHNQPNCDNYIYIQKTHLTNYA